MPQKQNSWAGAWLGRSPDGLVHQRARDVVRPTGGIVRGKFPSRKNGRMVHYEGLLELDAIYLFEASPHVVSYTEQPETVRYPDGGKLRRYTPDFELTLDTGITILVEIKPQRNADEADVKHKLACVAEYFSREGRRYCILTDKRIRIEPRLASLKWIYHQAPRIHASELKSALALKQIADDFPMSIAQAYARLITHDLEPYSLLIRRALICDLENTVTSDTSINLNMENDHEWFLIFDQHGF